MLNFEEELEKFQPSMDIEKVEDVVYHNNLADVTDIVMKNRKGLSKMRCPRCDANVSDTATLCTFCGQNLSVIHYIRRVSNTYYNLGLEKAKVRDLSGAIVVLKKSLEFNKKNTNARNLLGLIYYG